MSYIFPKRRLRDQDVLDPVEINDDVQPVVENYGGRINQHNLAAGLAPAVEANAYYKVHYAVRSEDSGFGVHTAYTDPSVTTGGNDHLVPVGSGWSVVSDVQLDITTGTSVLWVVARVQIIDGSIPGNVQLALAVNGALIEGTVTGMPDPYDNAVRGELPNPTKTEPNKDNRPGPRVEVVRSCSAQGPGIWLVRFGAMVPVPAGSTTVRVLCRRLGTQFNQIGLTNRQLMAIELPVVAASAVAFDEVNVEAFEPEDTISQQTLGTDRVDRIRQKLNNVRSGALARGSCDHYHLTSKVGSGTAQTALAPASTNTISSYYPGFETATLATSSHGSVGWYPVHAGSNELGVSSLTISKGCYLIVHANVQVRHLELYDPPRPHPLQHAAIYGALCFILKRSGQDPEVVPASECYIQHYNMVNDGVTRILYDWNNGSGVGDKPTRPLIDSQNLDVSLLAVIEFGDSGHAIGNVDYIKVMGSTMSAPHLDPNGLHYTQMGSAYIQMSTRRANISVLHLEKT